MIKKNIKEGIKFEFNSCNQVKASYICKLKSKNSVYLDSSTRKVPTNLVLY
jgi:hypothetical protein